MKLLEVDNLSVDTDHRRIIHRIAFSLEHSRIFGLAGQSGAGKTVLAYALCGLLSPPMKVSEGVIRIAGENIAPNHPKAWRDKRGREIFMMFQSAAMSLNPYLKIGKQIAEALEDVRRISYKTAVRQTEALLEKVGLDANLSNAYPFQLSGGMQQRILIAIAIGLNPKILIADEPTTGLDPLTKLHILNLLRSLKEEQGTAILFISHDLKAISYLAENMGIIHRGHLIESGTVTEILTCPKESYPRELVKTLDPVT